MPRKYLDDNGQLWLAEGDYGQNTDGNWLVRPPGRSMGELEDHDVTEHSDGTITVSPSIRSEWGERPYWHGYLERGEWRKTT